MSGLIEGLPDAVALQCLARVPFYFHPHLQLVCHLWKDAVVSPELLRIRKDLGASEELLCVSAFEPENTWQLYSPIKDLWLTLPILPSQIRRLSRFGVVSISRKLFVLGGGSDAVDPSTGDNDGIFATNEVWAYDPILQCWDQRASMLVPRSMFACCVLDGKIIVAGGFTNFRKSITKAEIYDPEQDLWAPLQDLLVTHNSACTGIVIDGKVHVLHKGISKVQVLDPETLHWVVEDYGWLQGPMAVIHGELYVLSHGVIYKQDREQGKNKVIASATEFQTRIGFAMVGLGDELYMIGGVIGPGRWNVDIKPLSDVDVLSVRNERPSWRQVNPMTLCNGTILGCTLLKI
ncbi:F-box/kelch-repeat protein skip30 [Ranunculus cassubicifolius]